LLCTKILLLYITLFWIPLIISISRDMHRDDGPPGVPS
jgi:hypothetical protein